MEVGEREIIYLSLHCHHQNDFCIKVEIDESHFNDSKLRGAMSQDSVHRPQLLKRKESRSRFEPRPLCLPVQRLTARPNRLIVDNCGEIGLNSVPFSGVHNSGRVSVEEGAGKRCSERATGCDKNRPLNYMPQTPV